MHFSNTLCKPADMLPPPFPLPPSLRLTLFLDSLHSLISGFTPSAPPHPTPPCPCSRVHYVPSSFCRCSRENAKWICGPVLAPDTELCFPDHHVNICLIISRLQLVLTDASLERRPPRAGTLDLRNMLAFVIHLVNDTQIVKAKEKGGVSV